MRKVTVVVMVNRNVDLEGDNPSDPDVETVVFAGELFPGDAIDKTLAIMNRGREEPHRVTYESLSEECHLYVYTEIVR